MTVEKKLAGKGAADLGWAGMSSGTTQSLRYVRNAVIFVACLIFAWLLPLVGWVLNSGFLIMVPQLLFPYDAMYLSAAGLERSVLNESIGHSLNLVQWTLVGIAFVWFGSRLRIGPALLLCGATIVAVGVLTQLVLRLLGISVSFYFG